MHYHLFRHTFATNYLIQIPNDVFGLQDRLGHEQLETTRIYVHLASQLGARSFEARRTSTLDEMGKNGLKVNVQLKGQQAAPGSPPGK